MRVTKAGRDWEAIPAEILGKACPIYRGDGQLGATVKPYTAKVRPRRWCLKVGERARDCWEASILVDNVDPNDLRILFGRIGKTQSDHVKLTRCLPTQSSEYAILQATPRGRGGAIFTGEAPDTSPWIPIAIGVVGLGHLRRYKCTQMICLLPVKRIGRIGVTDSGKLENVYYLFDGVHLHRRTEEERRLFTKKDIADVFPPLPFK